MNPALRAPARGLRARLRRMLPGADNAVAWLRLWRVLAVLVLLSGFAPLALANCLVRVDPMPMGQYDPIGTHATQPNDTGSATVTVTCNSPPGSGSPNIVFNADLGPGLHASGLQRRMQGAPGRHLSYGVFLDAGRALAFGSQSGGTTVSCQAGESSGYCTGGRGAGRERWARFTVHGRIPAGQDPMAGSYADTPVLTVTY